LSSFHHFNFILNFTLLHYELDILVKKSFVQGTFINQEFNNYFGLIQVKILI